MKWHKVSGSGYNYSWGASLNSFLHISLNAERDVGPFQMYIGSGYYTTFMGSLESAKRSARLAIKKMLEDALKEIDR